MLSPTLSKLGRRKGLTGSFCFQHGQCPSRTQPRAEKRVFTFFQWCQENVNVSGRTNCDIIIVFHFHRTSRRLKRESGIVEIKGIAFWLSLTQAGSTGAVPTLPGWTSPSDRCETRLIVVCCLSSSNDRRWYQALPASFPKLLYLQWHEPAPVSTLNSYTHIKVDVLDRIQVIINFVFVGSHVLNSFHARSRPFAGGFTTIQRGI